MVNLEPMCVIVTLYLAPSMPVNFVEVRFFKVFKVDPNSTLEMVILKVVVGIALKLVCKVLPDC